MIKFLCGVYVAGAEVGPGRIFGGIEIMLRKFRIAAASALFVLSSTIAAAAATVSDPTLYTDLDVNVTNNFAGFNIIGPASGPASLFVRFGQWTGNPAVLDLTFTFNGTALPTVQSSDAYFTVFQSNTFDVSSLVHSGLNTLSVFATNVSGGPTTYAVGELQLDFAQPGAVPIPAALPLFATGVGGLGLIGWRRKRKAAAAV